MVYVFVCVWARAYVLTYNNKNPYTYSPDFLHTLT